MRRFAALCVVVGVVFSVGSVWAEDYNPPPWRDGGNTTFSGWGFDDGSFELVPPDWFNANPGVSQMPTFSIENDPPNTSWVASHQGASGVWRLESPSNITIDIENYDLPNPIKEIWMQITYQAIGDGEPFIVTNPGWSSLTTSDVQVSEGSPDFLNVTYHIIIEPNPLRETIWIQPLDCTLYIDQIVIDTICTVPEPATICLFGLGALALLRKRKA
jgi:hypothetical protein